MRLAWVLAVAPMLTSCGGGLPTPQDHKTELPEGATAAMAKCNEGPERLHPFIVTWDATEQAEFSGHTHDSVVVVKLAGCRLEMLPSCRVGSGYKFAQTSGNLQSVAIRDEDKLHAELPLGAASLSGHLRSAHSLELSYFVRGMSYATSPMLFRSQLGAGCEGATHFVVNYAAGAYRVDTGHASEAGGGVATPVGGGGVSKESAGRALYEGGVLGSCQSDSGKCEAPVRLRLVSIQDGAPPEELKAFAANAITKPSDTGKAKLTEQQVRDTLQANQKALSACYSMETAQAKQVSGNITARIRVARDGTVTNKGSQVTGDLSPTFVACVDELVNSFRFPASSDETDVTFPFAFRSGG